MRYLRKAAWLALAAALLLGVDVRADWKPDRPIRLIVPFAPGAATDISARTISTQLAAMLGQPIVIENQGAARGVVGTDAGAKAAPDGYTWTLAHDPPFTILPNVRKLRYDPVKDFEPVAMIATIPMLLVVRPDLRVNSVKELIELARAQPGKITFASSGIGATAHLAAELFKHESKIDILHVPYKGGAQAITDLLGGQVDMVFISFGPVIQHIRSGKLKALGVSVPRRYASLPEVPTIAEAGAPGAMMDNMSWYGVFGPAKLPVKITTQLHKEFATALKLPLIIERLDNLRLVPVGDSPKDFAGFMEGELKRFAEMVKLSGYQPE